jgi:hypothetical protein
MTLRKLRFRLTHPISSAITCVAVCAFALSASANTYSVAATGSDSNNGSQSAPFRQVTKAISVSHPGDTILVGDGAYNAILIKNVVGTASQPLVIQARGTNAVINTDPSALGNADVELSAYIVISGFKTFNAPSAGFRVNQSNHISILNCVAGNNQYWGIFTRYADHVDLENNECYGSVIQHGIYVSNSADFPVVRGNYSHDNAGQGIQFNGDITSGAANPGDPVSVGGGQTTILDGVISNGIVENNRVFNNGSMGIYGDGLQTTIIRNNLVIGSRSKGIAVYQVDGGDGPAGIYIVNNTVLEAAGGGYAAKIAASAGPNVIVNNIFLHPDNPGHAGIDWSDESHPQLVTSDYNIYGIGNGQAGDEPHSFEAAISSLFVNAAGNDFHLSSSSPAIDRGENLSSVLSDIEGNVRPQGASTDIGAYEFAGAVVPAPSLVISPSTVTAGTSAQGTVTLNVPAPPAGAQINLSSDKAVATVPASLNIAGGQTTGVFTIATGSVSVLTVATITATLGGRSANASLSIAPPVVNAPGFVLGVNFGGPAVVVDGNTWLSQATAMAQGMTVANASWGPNTPYTLVPTPPDAGTQTMLLSDMWTPNARKGQGFTVTLPLPNGNYQVYLWEAEDVSSNARSMNVRLQGIVVASNIGSQAKGHWTKFGPYNATVTDGVMTLTVVRNSKGDPQMSGMAIFMSSR